MTRQPLLREESAWTGEEAFRARQYKFLMSLLDRENIYYLPQFQALYEGQTRMNLWRAVRALLSTQA